LKQPPIWKRRVKRFSSGRKISGLFQLDKRYLPPVGFVGGLTAVFAGVGARRFCGWAPEDLVKLAEFISNVRNASKLFATTKVL